MIHIATDIARGAVPLR